MFEGFEEFKVSVQPDVTIYAIKRGSGPPLLLLHGFPQTHHIWHKITPSLTPNFTVIALDLRGYGASSKPPSTSAENHKPYSKSTMAQDCVSAMSKLGFEKFSVIGHDRGGRVAHKMAVNHPEKVDKLMILDICPTLAMFSQTDQAFATAYWHWFFLIQPNPFPETLITKNSADFTARFFGAAGYTGDGEVFDAKAMEMYVRQFGDMTSVHGMCEDYRAAATVDLEEARKDLEVGRKVKCPVRVLWGSKGVIEKKFDALKVWKEVCEGKVTGEKVESGHYIPEENPKELLRHIREFFV